MKVTFTGFQKQEGAKHVCLQTEVVKVALTFEEALKQLNETHPQHGVAEHLKGLYRIEE